jgi:hypothetical protein
MPKMMATGKKGQVSSLEEEYMDLRREESWAQLLYYCRTL